ncbi:MAG: hypothetical protein K6C33_07895 [Desulfovibrio sp.]|nr:hypothetical protein [Desulfovibrio sp.]
MPSLRDERGAYLTPGLFTGVRGARAQTAALAEARILAQRQGVPLFAFAVEASLAGRGADRPANTSPDSSAGSSPNSSAGRPAEGAAGILSCASLDLARLTRAQEAELLALLGLGEEPGKEPGKGAAQTANPAFRRRLASLAQASPAGFLPRLFAHPACQDLALVQWSLPGGTRGVAAGREGLPLATVRPSRICSITLCAPAKDLLKGLAGEARQARIRYLLGLPD